MVLTGHHFFTLHEKFEELYDEANGHIDVLAERILTIGGRPVSTLKECLEIATIQEAKGNEQKMTWSVKFVRILRKSFMNYKRL